MSKETIVYKAVVYDYMDSLGKYKSCVVLGKHRSTYIIDKKTYPKVGSLMAFSTKKQAIRFFGNPDVVLKCTAKLSEIQPSLVLLAPDRPGEIEKYWNIVKRHYPIVAPTLDGCNFSLVPPPAGTVFCDWIKPIEVIT